MVDLLTITNKMPGRLKVKTGNVKTCVRKKRSFYEFAHSKVSQQYEI